MKESNVRKNIFLSLLVAIGVSIGYVENMIPIPVAFPGARLGLSNIVILTTIIVFGNKEGFLVALLKSVLLMLATGQVNSFFYSFAGAFLSSIAMVISYKYCSNLSIIGISLIGSFFHNVGQVAVATIIVQNVGLFAYLPFLLILGVFTGIFVGIVSKMLISHLNSIKIDHRSI